MTNSASLASGFTCPFNPITPMETWYAICHMAYNLVQKHWQKCQVWCTNIILLLLLLYMNGLYVAISQKKNFKSTLHCQQK